MQRMYKESQYFLEETKLVYLTEASYISLYLQRKGERDR